ncbi:uncharacterized protein LOC110827471 [Zootermopsis nevadensis]|uniref:uncharacterized protein LOC110827471 n=1 Tax=Zootermopsis nevadensis TaxID=136037 RepID=UPI000B8E4FC0|nr:uncharacterized protein LOC110827471 [Zootermopsis nevadensis]
MTEALIPADPSLSPSEERRRTGRYVAVSLVVIACLLGLHHAFVKQNVVLAGLIVPALIMVFYILWVLHTAKKASCKHAGLDAKEVPTVIIEEATPSPSDSETHIPTLQTASGFLNNAAEVP